MSASDRQNRPDLIDSLLATPEAFEFLAAVQLLRAGAAFSGAALPGEGDPAPFAAGRFIASPTLGYPETQLTSASAQALEETAAPTLATNFLGLHGPTGVLPAYVTRAVSTTGRDFALAQVLDFFNNEFAHTFSKAAELAHPHLLARDAILFDGQSTDGDGAECGSPDPVSRLLTGIAGSGCGAGGDVGTRSRRHELAISRYYAVAWRHRPMPLTSLQSMLRDLLQVPVRVLPFEPLWTSVDQGWRLRLHSKKKFFSPESGLNDASMDVPGQANATQESEFRGPRERAWVLGKRTRQAQGGVLIRIGPLDLRTFRRLLPPRAPEAGGQPVKKRLLWRICTLIGAALGPWADFVLQPVLAREDVHPWILRGRRSIGKKATAPTPSVSTQGRLADPKEPFDKIPRAGLGRNMFLLRKPAPGENVPPRDFDFDQLKITSIAVRRATRIRQPSRRRETVDAL